MKLQHLRGTEDLFPRETFLWNTVESRYRDLFHQYNYHEIRTPLLELTALFQRGIGESTDIVQKEMYTFSDRGGRSVSLRPEATASVVRAYLQHKIYGEAQPAKYYYIGPMFRYERPQTGRNRQFHQTGVEALGSEDPALDAEIITLAWRLLTLLGLKNNYLLLNSIGCHQCRPPYISQFTAFLEDKRERLCHDCQRRLEMNPLRVLDCKQKACQDTIDGAPTILDELCISCGDHFQRVQSYLQGVDVPYQLEEGLVRGLDYYTRTTFEIIDTNLGAQDAILGGGRYDGLAEEIGERRVPGIGFAMGLERLLISIKKEGLSFPQSTSPELYLVKIGEVHPQAFCQLQRLRDKGIRTEMDYLGRSVKGQMKAANRCNARYTLILGEEELKRGKVLLRHMESGEEEQVPLQALPDYCLERLKGRTNSTSTS